MWPVLTPTAESALQESAEQPALTLCAPILAVTSGYVWLSLQHLEGITLTNVGRL